MNSQSHRHSESDKHSINSRTTISKPGRPRPLQRLALALGGALALLAGGAAQAGPDVRWSVTVGSPGYGHHGHHGYPGVHVLPRPSGIYVHPAPVIYGPPAHGYYRERRSHKHHHHHHHHYYERDDDDDDDDDHRRHRHGAHRDRDRNGVPDRWDRRPGNPWRY